jgi:beta-phosphoglucomutase
MQAILFDFDGVVIRSMEDHYEGWRKALEEYGIDMAPEELYVMEGSGVEELANQFTRKFNIPHDEAPNIIRKKSFYYDQIKKIEFYPNLIDVLQWIKEKELKTALVTGGERFRVMETLENFGLAGQFNAIVTADDVEFTKPSPEPYLKAAEILNVEPKACVVIENAPLGIRSAKNAGMYCIAVTTTLPRKYLTHADVVTDSLEEVLTTLKRMY